MLKKLENDKDELQEAFYSLADEYSKNLFLSKIVSLVKYKNITCLANFLEDFSDSVREYGPVPLFGYPESRLYFSNTLNDISNGQQFLIDVGAYDGCSSLEFRRQCIEKGLTYKVVAFEPDPNNFVALKNALGKDPFIQLENLGLWSHSAKFRFKTSNNVLLKSSSEISDDGDIFIKVVLLDSYKFNSKVTIIKADPPGLNVALEVLKGAKNTITEHLPLLIFPAYHSFDAIYKMPLALKASCHEYEIFLRHLSWSIGETDVFAVPPGMKIPVSLNGPVITQ